jgi:hypothetical protein
MPSAEIRPRPRGAPAARLAFAVTVLITLVSSAQQEDANTAVEPSSPPVAVEPDPPAPVEETAQAPLTREIPPVTPVAPPVVRASGRRMSRLTVAPGSLLFFAVGMEFETAVGDDSSFYVGPQVSLVGVREPDSYAFDIHVGVRLFPNESQRAPKGFWIGPEARVSAARTSSVSAMALALLGTTGYTFVTSGGFTASLGGGLGGAISSVGLILAYGLHGNIGYAF